jgi:hypothetical protein
MAKIKYGHTGGTGGNPPKLPPIKGPHKGDNVLPAKPRKGGKKYRRVQNTLSR